MVLPSTSGSGLGGPVEFNGRSVKYAERVLNLVVEPTVDSEPNRWVELAGRQQKASDDVARCAESHPSIRIDPRQGSGNSPLHGGRLPWFLGVGRRPDDVHPHLGYKP